MKKLMSLILMAIILFNFIFCNNAYVEASEPSDDTSTAESTDSESKKKSDYMSVDDEDGVTNGDLNDLMEESKASYGGSSVNLEMSDYGGIIGTVAGIITAFLNIFPGLIELVMAICVQETFTIEKAVFGEIGIYDVNYFNTSGEYTLGTEGNEKKEKINLPEGIAVLRNVISRFYYILRLFATAISLVVLIYVGIRMAISSTSDDKAKYKKMLFGWVESIILLYLMQYIISLIFGIGRIFQNLIFDLRCYVVEGGSASFESEIYDNILSMMFVKSGWNYVMYSIILWILVFIQTKFFLMYFKRLITVGFLILISPLITVTYPIDKIGDSKAQAFSVWLNELMMNVFIQPIHALIYLIFMFTAGDIAKISAWVGLAFLLALTKIEKIILQLFALNKVTSLKPVGEHRKGK